MILNINKIRLEDWNTYSKLYINHSKYYYYTVYSTWKINTPKYLDFTIGISKNKSNIKFKDVYHQQLSENFFEQDEIDEVLSKIINIKDKYILRKQLET